MFKKAFYTFGTSLIIAMSNFLIIMLLTKSLGAVGMAEIGVFLFACMLIAVLNAVFGSTSIVYLYPRHNFNAIFIVTTLWAVFSTGLSIIVASVFKLYTNHLLWLFFIALLQSLYISYLSFVLAQNNIQRYNALRLLQPIFLLLAIASFCLSVKLNYGFYFWSLGFSYLLPIVFLLFCLPKINFSNLRKNELKCVVRSFFAFGGLSQLTNLFQLLNYRISYVFIGWFCTKADLGAMVLAMTFVDGIWLFKNNVSILKYVEASLEKSTSNSNIKMTRLSVVVTLFFLLGVLVVPNWAYGYFFGKDFFQLKEILILMSPGILVMAGSSVFANYFSGLGKVYINFIVAIAGFVTFLPAVYFLTCYYGLTGAAIANNVPLIIGSLIVFYYYFSFKREKV